MSDLMKLTEDNYEAEISTGSIAIDFYADWCGPCKMMAPIFEEASEEYEGKIRFAKINIDEQRDLAMQNKVMSIPTLLFFKDGEVVERVTGVIDAAVLKEKLDSIL